MRLWLAFLFIATSASFAQEKVLAPAALDVPGGVPLEDYGDWRLWRMPPVSRAALGADAEQLRPLPNADMLAFDAATFNTQREAPQIPSGWRATHRDEGARLMVVQFHGPVKQQWLDVMTAAGLRPIAYVPHNAYLVYGDGVGRAALADLPVQYLGEHHPYYKLSSSLREQAVRSDQPEQVQVVEVLSLPDISLPWPASRVVAERRLGSFQLTQVALSMAEIAETATFGSVVWLQTRPEFQLLDEVQTQVLATDVTTPSPGYLDWLLDLGFSQDPALYPVVDISDDGIGNGSVQSGDATLHELGRLSMPTRLTYILNCTALPTGEGPGGHGHINLSIAGGYDDRLGFPFQDELGFQRGLGVNPFGRFAGTRIFDIGLDQTRCPDVIAAIYRAGGRISSNSWGCPNCSGEYNAQSFAYDLGVRDADPDLAGNQELSFVFAAGNTGSLGFSINVPGNGKNVVTVGASENWRPTWFDGCGIGFSDADFIHDIARFSSRGPAVGNRIKPDVVAPGTHIQGTASTSPNYRGNGICDAIYPPDQTLFAASSGTSQATPAVAGALSLIHYWLVQNDLIDEDDGGAPSPALLKAYLLSHTRGLIGAGAGTDLGNFNQGYGLPNLDQAFSDQSRYIVDQAVRLDAGGDSWTLDAEIVSPSLPVHITLAYTDAPGLVGSTASVNDLDLEITYNGEVYRGNQFTNFRSSPGGLPDPVNTVEAIRLPPGQSGSLQVRVLGVNIAGDGVPGVGDATDQDFALVITNVSGGPDFGLTLDQTRLQLCAPTIAQVQVDTQALLGFDETVDLSVEGLPSGVTASLDQSTLAPGGGATLSLTLTDSVVAGLYELSLVAEAGRRRKTRLITLEIANGTPLTPTPLAPSGGAETPRDLSLNWSEEGGLTTYELQVSQDMDFADLWEAATVSGGEYPVRGLPPGEVFYWRVRGVNACGDGAFSTTRSFQTVDQVDSFTENFSAGNDLSFRQITWTPTRDANGYSVCREPLNTVYDGWTRGQSLPLSPTSSSQVSLSQPIEFFGQRYATVHMSAKGFVSFVLPGTDPPTTLEEHFRLPRISGFFQNVADSSGDHYFVTRDLDAITFTWREVRDADDRRPNTFHIRFFDDGRIRIQWESVTSLRGIAGLSRGLGLPTNFVVDDLASGLGCSGFSLTVNTPEACRGDELRVAIQVEGVDDLPVWLSAENLPDGVQAWFAKNPVKPGIETTLILSGLSGQTQLDARIVGERGGREVVALLIPLLRTVAAAPQLVAPAQGAVVELAPLVLSWQAINSARYYEVTLAEDPGMMRTLDVLQTTGSQIAWQRIVAPNLPIYWQVRAFDGCANPSSAVGMFRSAPPPDALTTTQVRALAGKTVVFGLLGLTDYETCFRDIDRLPVNTQTPVPFSNGSFLLSFDQIFPFFGRAATEVYINVNGNLTFGAPDQSAPGTTGHFEAPRISAVFANLDLSQASITYAKLTDQVVITWINAVTNGLEDNDFQIQLFYSGAIHITWLNAGNSAVAGLSEGSNAATNGNFLANPCADVVLRPVQAINICGGQPVTLDVTVDGQFGFAAPVALSALAPNGALVSLSSSQVNVGDSFQLTVSAAPEGPSDLVLEARADGRVFSFIYPLFASSGVNVPADLQPVVDAVGVDLRPLFQWSGFSYGYRIQIATDAAYQSLVVNQLSDQGLFIPDQTLAAGTGYFWRVRAESSCGVGAWAGGRFTTRQAVNGPVQSFVGDFDLSFGALAFTPLGDGDYDFCFSTVTRFPDEPGGTLLNLDDEATQRQSLGFTFDFFGQSYEAVYISANGNLTFGAADATHVRTLDDHFQTPRIAALFADLDPGAGGEIWFDAQTDRAIITYTGVPFYNAQTTAEFQIELTAEGLITITYLDIPMDSAIVGLSDGLGTPTSLLLRDFDTALDCGFCSGLDLNSDGQIDPGDLDLLIERWGLNQTGLDDDGWITILDLLLLPNEYGACNR